MVHAWRASIELWMHAGSWESTREAFEWHEVKPSALPTSQVHAHAIQKVHEKLPAMF